MDLIGNGFNKFLPQKICVEVHVQGWAVKQDLRFIRGDFRDIVIRTLGHSVFVHREYAESIGMLLFRVGKTAIVRKC
jgi:hypothetical protein